MVAVLTVMGCANGIEERETSKDVNVTFDFSFWESGSMSRSASALYTNFYDKYIKTKILTPTTYSLSLKTNETPVASVITGYWDKKDGIRLPEGTYDLTGVSNPINSNNVYVDSLSILFKEKVTITKESTAIVLKAINASYMLMFDAENIKEIKYIEYNENNKDKEYNLKKADDIFYVFIT